MIWNQNQINTYLFPNPFIPLTFLAIKSKPKLKDNKTI